MIRIVDTRPEHLDDILLMEQQCFSVPWTRDQLAAQMSDSMYIFLAAEDESGRAVGYVGLMYVLDEGYISNVAVSPSRRREGIADMLLTELYARAKAKKLSFLTLEVRESNAPAQSLYKKHGYTEVGMRKGYYSLPKEDAVLMTCFLSEEEK
ncbi:MAG: ribosomal protein S18-alanine N-acetyltransferase [Oscillospiraceae bacterium]|nr:ribosomal protein S18-alanine N-acetyltransferase [Oscillospiraceae bacterium]